MLFFARYYVEFSKPDKLRPIPEGTVKVYFDITIGDGPDEYDIEFNFENESLKHRLDSTMREAKFQVSKMLDFLFKKCNLGAILSLRAGLTAFLRTSTRLSSFCISVLSSNTRVMLTRRISQWILSSPSSTS